MELRDRHILITGGSLGIGKATAKLLTGHGARVAITGRDAERLKKAADETGAFPIVADVSSPGDVEKTFEMFLDQFESLDCLINNAGIGRPGFIEDLTLEDFEDIFKVNVFGAALMAARAVPLFKKQNYGHIINVGSTASLRGYPRGSVYVGTKFALRGMTQCWQAELRKHNIRVVQINPSEVATAFGDPERKERQAPPNKLRSEEIAHAVKSVLELDDRGLIPELAVWATNPW